ncbi:16S rRNA (cytosine(967)-C(5))-methyltransferase RsmB [Furfurilactobacillus siliginis]|uniref:16S rRNA (cytosine(967)-C(5))-methyltransferase n=1 Tax=Furfurilactobacillus siliginis TaxID=348151 RepID=A0A0R2LCF0_9LACO|nr:16S rRNA (cytosine(967)-C(5))-methyltransferase RsmB [Furfurilactobacillus siliginis]KRN96892.1 16S rRNA methyltransferase B [Furfurilactobacillus siliginis]GEK28088.1 ribosomal RNA small subunit methyltransferase B [Furfurilactobacillus siliginis]
MTETKPTEKTPITNPRLLALDVLTTVSEGGYSNLALNGAINDSALSQRDAALCTEIVYGVLQHQLLLDFWLRPHLKRPDRVKPWVKTLLQTAVYQMEFLDKVPTRAIFDETINIAKERGHEGIRRFVTAILHTLQREGVADVATVKDPLTRQSIKYSVPMPWIQRLRKEVGDDKTHTILESINRPAAQSVRVNPAAGERDTILAQLAADGLKWSDSEVAGDGLRITAGHPASSSAFKQGLITIQDESAMLPVEALQVSGGMQVLDACAAPGGKTTQLAAQLDADAGGLVTALDLHEHKIGLINMNAKRLHVANRIAAEQMDARKVDTHFAAESFDRVLVDAPCSGLGLLRRKPEIRYAKTLADSAQLQEIQLSILASVAPTVKKNGILVYSTCTILNQENADVATAFIEQHPDFEAIKVQTTRNLKPERTTPWLTIYPDDYDSDGFFISAFRRKETTMN